jgi:CheY-like chemotaxis protein
MMCRQASFLVGGSNGKDSMMTGLRILVVDDSVLVLKVVSRLIQSEGHIVDCKKDGIEALEALKNIEYDAVLMDIHMPEMGGLEASFEFRTHEGLMHQYRGKAQSSKLKIIAMSADFNDELIKEVMNAGFDGFLAKPLTVSGFRELKLRPSLMRNASCRMTNLLVQG